MIKQPPQSIEAEQSVIGGLILDSSAWDDVSEKVSHTDFYRNDHQLIFKAIGSLTDESKPVDIVTVQELLLGRGELEECGGLPYLAELASNTPSVANIKAYADIVRERSIMRQLLVVASDIADTVYTPDGKDAAELLDLAERRVFDISEKGPKRGEPEAIKPLLAKVVDRIDTLFSSDSAITGITTGFTELDHMLSGLQKQDLIIVAGRPSMGKTAFAVNIAENAAMKVDKPILVFSMEMPGESLTMRMISSLGGINQSKLRSGKLNEDDWPRMNTAISMLAKRKIFIDDTGGLSPQELRTRARRIHREHGEIGMIVIDYLQLMQVPGCNNRTEEISQISRSLKGLAKELNTPVVALSQLNRGLEQRQNKRPIMSDLRESGAIEQDADVIMFIYRDEVYNEETTEKGIGEIIIGKQRNGAIGTCRLAFKPELTKFENLEYNSSNFE